MLVITTRGHQRPVSRPFRPGIENPLLDAIAEPTHKVVADLGCGSGPLLPHLVNRFDQVVARG